eukprot:gene3377-5924_t
MDPNRNIQPTLPTQMNFNQPPKLMSYSQLQNMIPIQPLHNNTFIQNIQNDKMPDEEFFNKMDQIGKEIQMIKDEKHDEFNNIRQNFIQEKLKKIETAENFKKMKIQSIENSFNQLKEQTENDYQNDVVTLKEKMINDLLEKQKKLESEKLGTPYTHVDLKSNQKTQNKKKVEKKKKKNPPGLNINLTLRTDEIYEDLSFLSTSRSTAKIY